MKNLKIKILDKIRYSKKPKSCPRCFASDNGFGLLTCAETDCQEGENIDHLHYMCAGKLRTSCFWMGCQWTWTMDSYAKQYRKQENMK